MQSIYPQPAPKPRTHCPRCRSGHPSIRICGVYMDFTTMCSDSWHG